MFVVLNGFSQLHIRNNVINDTNTNNYNVDTDSFFDFNGNTYFTNIERNFELGNQYKTSNFKLWRFNNGDEKPTLIKEIEINYSLEGRYTNVYLTDSNYFYLSIPGEGYPLFNSRLLDIWCSDGTSNGTKRVISSYIQPNKIPVKTVAGVFGNDLCYVNDYDGELYRFNFEEASHQLMTIRPIWDNNRQLYKIQNRFFNLEFQNNVYNLKSVENGTVTILNTSTFEIYLLGIINNKLIFRSNGTIFSTDGTIQNTITIRSAFRNVEQGYVAQNKLYYFDRFLISTDGTVENTNVADSSLNLSPLYYPTNFNGNSKCTVREKIIYRKNKSNTTHNYSEIWVTDGYNKSKLIDTSVVAFYDYGNYSDISIDNNSLFFQENNAQNYYIYQYNSDLNTLTKLPYLFDKGLGYTKVKTLQNDGSIIIEGALRNNLAVGSELYKYKNNSLNLVDDFNKDTKAGYYNSLKVIDDAIFYLKYPDYPTNGSLSSYSLVYTNGSTESYIEFNISSYREIIKFSKGIFLIFQNNNVIELNINSKSFTQKPSNISDIYSVKMLNQYVIVLTNNSVFNYNPVTHEFILLKTLNGDYSYYSKSIIFNNKVYFTTKNLNSTNLYVTDGTNTGTFLVKTIPIDPLLSINITQNSILLYFYNYLWKSDGTPEGTISAIQYPVDYDPYKSNVPSGCNIGYSDGDFFYKSIVNSSNERKFYRTTQDLSSIELLQSSPEQVGNNMAMCKCNNAIYSFTSSFINSGKLWKYDLNTLQTSNVITINYYIISTPICTNNRYLWMPFVEGISYRSKLVIFDTETNSVTQIDDIKLIDYSNDKTNIFNYGNSVIFPKIDKKYGIEIFKADVCTTSSQGNHVLGDYYYLNPLEASEIINSPLHIGLFSEKSILLKPGFEVQNGAVFNSSIQQCY